MAELTTALQQSSFNWNRPDINSYTPTDYFSASSSLPRKTKQEAEQDIQHISEQANAVKVMLANLGLTKMLVRADRAVTDIDAAIAGNKLAYAGHQMKLGYEAGKLQVDRQMYQTLLQHHTQKSQNRIQSSAIGVQMSGLQLQAAQQRFQQAQAELTGVGGGVGAAQRQSFPGLGVGQGSTVLERARSRVAQSRSFLESLD